MLVLFVPVEAQPAQALEDGLDAGVGVALDVGVVQAQDHRAAVVASIEPVEDEGAGAADVQEAGGRRGETDAGSFSGRGNRISHCLRVFSYFMLTLEALEDFCRSLVTPFWMQEILERRKQMADENNSNSSSTNRAGSFASGTNWVDYSESSNGKSSFKPVKPANLVRPQGVKPPPPGRTK